MCTLSSISLPYPAVFSSHPGVDGLFVFGAICPASSQTVSHANVIVVSAADAVSLPLLIEGCGRAIQDEEVESLGYPSTSPVLGLETLFHWRAREGEISLNGIRPSFHRCRIVAILIVAVRLLSLAPPGKLDTA